MVFFKNETVPQGLSYSKHYNAAIMNSSVTTRHLDLVSTLRPRELSSQHVCHCSRAARCLFSRKKCTRKFDRVEQSLNMTAM